MRVNNPQIEQYRVTIGSMGSTKEAGNNGVFIVPQKNNLNLICIVSDGLGWEHVSVEVNAHPMVKHRTPTWGEMNYIKKLFWEEEETVVQYHPQRSAYVNIHPFVLHLWRETGAKVNLPPTILV